MCLIRGNVRNLFVVVALIAPVHYYYQQILQGVVNGKRIAYTGSYCSVVREWSKRLL